MSAVIPITGSHSAVVRMELCVNGHIMPISQLGPDFLVLEKSFEHPPTDAEIRVCVDDHEDRWRVRLVEGIQPGQRKTVLSPVCGTNSPA